EYLQPKLAGNKNTLLAGPEADKEMLQFVSPAIRRRVLLAHLTAGTRNRVQRYLGLPIGNLMLRQWLQGKWGAAWIERAGLPRHSIELFLGARPFTLHVDPRSLIRNVDFMPR